MLEGDQSPTQSRQEGTDTEGVQLAGDDPETEAGRRPLVVTHCDQATTNPPSAQVGYADRRYDKTQRDKSDVAQRMSRGLDTPSEECRRPNYRPGEQPAGVARIGQDQIGDDGGQSESR